MFSSIPLQMPSGFITRKPEYCRGKFTEEYSSEKTPSLSSPYSWLTGIRVDVPPDQYVGRRDGLDHVYAFVKLFSDFPKQPEFEWVQPVNVFQSFPWPIPARMVSSVHFRVEISLDYSDNAPINVGLTTMVYDLGMLPVGESYLFTNSSGQHTFSWNSLQEHCYDAVTGTGKLCRIVPQSSQLYGWREQLGCWTELDLLAEQKLDVVTIIV